MHQLFHIVGVVASAIIVIMAARIALGFVLNKIGWSK